MTVYIDRTGEPDDVFEREVLARVEVPMTPVPSSPVALLDQLDAARESARDGGWPGVERMRLIDEAEPKLTAAVRAVLELADELDGLVDDETVDEVARVAHGWTLNRIRAALTVTP